MNHFFTIRVFTGMITVLAVSLLSFFIFNALPGDPARVILGMDADEAAVQELREDMGLDRPVVMRYFKWIADFARGDMGESFGYERPVGAVIRETLPPTISLTLVSTAIAILLSFPLGIMAAKKQNKLPDFLISVFSQAGIVIPGFWLGILLLLLFSVKLGVLPAGGYIPLQEDPFGWFRSILLPSLSLGIISSAVLTRMIRTSILETMNADYTRTAMSKGISRKRLFSKHILKNAMIPVLNVLGLQTATILAGTIIIENVFSIPGLGRTLLMAVQRRDLPVVQGIVVWIALITIIINFTVDIFHMLLDPRIRV